MPSTSAQRAAARLAFARRALAQPTLELEPASADASFRSYWRTLGATPTLVVMDAPPGNEDVRPWLAIGQALAAAGIHVPTVHARDEAEGFLLIEDFGNRLYLDALSAETADALYGDAFGVLEKLETRADIHVLAPYAATFARSEMELMQPWFLERHLGVTTSASMRATIEQAIGVLIDNWTAQPTTFVHRDFHSRNLMLTDVASPGVIDFQGALAGPLTYDLASLLKDCYIRWPDARVNAWRDQHHRRLQAAGVLPAQVSAGTFARWFDLTGLQRHLKVLGLFCRLAIRDGKTGYLGDLPLVLAYVLAACRKYPELAALGNLLAQATRGRDLTTPQTPEPSCAR